MHNYPTLLPGHLKQGISALLQVACLHSYAWASVGELKYDTYVKFKQLYGEYDFVFFGDNGQGDLLCAQKMCIHGKIRHDSEATMLEEPRLLGAFIHEIQAPEHALSPHSLDETIILSMGDAFHSVQSMAMTLKETTVDAMVSVSNQASGIAQGLAHRAMTSREDLDAEDAEAAEERVRRTPEAPSNGHLGVSYSTPIDRVTQSASAPSSFSSHYKSTSSDGSPVAGGAKTTLNPNPNPTVQS